MLCQQPNSPGGYSIPWNVMLWWSSFSPCLQYRSPWQALTEPFEHKCPFTKSAGQQGIPTHYKELLEDAGSAGNNSDHNRNISCLTKVENKGRSVIPWQPQGTPYPNHSPGETGSSFPVAPNLGYGQDGNLLMTEANHPVILLTVVPNEARGALLDCSWLCQHLPLPGTPLRTREPSSLPHSKDHHWQRGMGWYPCHTETPPSAAHAWWETPRDWMWVFPEAYGSFG